MKTEGEIQMTNNQMVNSLTDIRKTKFTVLKDQQRSLNMQVRLAMQRHDTQMQADLEEKLKEITEQIDDIM
jgi:predicted  nucleic acid-binding Zn-ribbon protein